MYKRQVTFASGNQTGRVLLFDLFNFAFSGRNDVHFLLRYQHVIDANRDTGTSRQAEARLQQLISKYNRCAQTAFTEGQVDQTRDFFFLQRTIQNGEWQAFRQDFRQDRTTNGGFVAGNCFFEFAGFRIFWILGNTCLLYTSPSPRD